MTGEPKLSHFQEWKVGAAYCFYLPLTLALTFLGPLFATYAVILLSALVGMDAWLEGHFKDLFAIFAILSVPMVSRSFLRDAIDHCEALRRGYVDEAQALRLERAILALLNERDVWMPSYLVGQLRKTFEPSAVRLALESLYAQRKVAKVGSAYCDATRIKEIREARLRNLQARGRIRGYGEDLGDPETDELEKQAWRNWTGFAQSDPNLTR